MIRPLLIPSASSKENLSSLLLGVIFLLVYWMFGYDGIAFSDEVTYLQLGHQLWNNEAVVSDYHFTSRWGAFLFSGFFTRIFGFSDRYASLATLTFYLLTLFLVWKITPSGLRKWSVVFFVANIYLLHFLSKVYPDGFLVLWIILLPAAAIYRDKYPLLGAAIMATAFFIGFCTKETVVFLFPFPLILFLIDIRRKERMTFYYYFFGFSLFVMTVYLSYYQWHFGNWLYRFQTVNEGHYISEYTYHDKGIRSVIQRITYLPLLTFVDRTYWLWLVMAVPGIYYGIKKIQKPGLEFGLCCLCMLLGFWLMTSTLDFYNPIYLNPRHLITLIAPLSVCIGLGANYWRYSYRWKKALSTMLLLGAGCSLAFGSWKIAAFYSLIAGLLFLKPPKLKFIPMAICLILPTIYSAFYQYQLKNYPHFLNIFQKQAELATVASPLISHDFVYFSRDVLLQLPDSQAPLISLTDMEGLKTNPPEELSLLIYQYYKHAYPAEQELLLEAERWIEKHYLLVKRTEDQWVTVVKYRKK